MLEASLAHITSAQGNTGGSSRMHAAWAVAECGPSCLERALAAQPCARLGERMGAGLPSGASAVLRDVLGELGPLR